VPLFDGAERCDAAGGPVHKCLVFNFPEVLRVLAGSGCVAAVLSGHEHPGAFGVDVAGVHHITLESPLTHPAGAHAVAHVHADRVELQGFGAVASRVIPRCGRP